tara:strand:+ start:402 stop:575 length:174 start_codon:yes stop_codon:yes gene_type:complete
MRSWKVSVITELVTDHEVEAHSWEMAQQLAEAKALVRFLESRIHADILSCKAEEECD